MSASERWQETESEGYVSASGRWLETEAKGHASALDGAVRLLQALTLRFDAYGNEARTSLLGRSEFLEGVVNRTWESQLRDW